MGAQQSMPEMQEAVRTACKKSGNYEYDDAKALGVGAQGAVFMVTKKDTHDKVAVKVVASALLQEHLAHLPPMLNVASSVNTTGLPPMPGLTFKGNEDTYNLRAHFQQRELKAIADLVKHPHENIVCFYDIYMGGKFILLFMELVEGGCLREWINDSRPRSSQVEEVMEGVLAGLAHLHSHGYLHRDIKPENIMLKVDQDTMRKTSKLVDFGLIGMRPNTGAGAATQKYRAGTCPYMAPELWTNKGYTGATDIWAAGIVLYEMLMGDLPFNNGELFCLNHDHTTNDKDRYNDSINALYNARLGPLAELCHGMLQLCPSNRPTPTAALAWLRSGRRPGSVPKPAMAQAAVTKVFVAQKPASPPKPPKAQWAVPLAALPSSRPPYGLWGKGNYDLSNEPEDKEEDDGDESQEAAEKAAKASNGVVEIAAALAAGAAGAAAASVFAGPMAAAMAVEAMPTDVAKVAPEERQTVAKKEQAAAANTGGFYGALGGGVGGGALGAAGAAILAAFGVVAAPVLVAGATGVGLGFVFGGFSGRWAGWGVMCEKQGRATAAAAPAASGPA